MKSVDSRIPIVPQQSFDTFVKGHGPEVSPLMVISDYPTQDEIKVGRAFSGKSGDFVDALLKSNGWPLQKCYRTNYFKCPLVGFNSKNKKRSREAVETACKIADWNKIIIDEIRIIKPNAILALGELALNYLTDETTGKIIRYRGSVLPLNQRIQHALGESVGPVRVIPTYHPRDIFPQPLTRVATTIDFQRAIKHKNKTGPIETQGRIWIARSPDELIEYWKRARHGEFLATDIETSRNMITCASLCTDGEEAVSFSLLGKDLSLFQAMQMWRAYFDILRSSIPKVNQNIIYDVTFLERFGATINNVIGDTMLMANTIYPELPKGLDYLTSIYTEIPYYKDEGKAFDPKIHSTDQMLYYNAKDSLAAWRVWKLQQQDAEDYGVKNFYFNFVQPLFFHYKKVQERGILIDDDKRIQLIDKYDTLLNQNAIELNNFYGKELNVRSSDQVGTFVYEYLNCPPHSHITDSGVESWDTDEDTLVNIYLNEVKDAQVRRVLSQIILCRKLFNVLNLLLTPCHMDRRMRTAYNLGGTTTGRTSTAQTYGEFLAIKKNKIVKCQYGTAFQKITKREFKFLDQSYGKDLREIYVPSPGYEFFAFDGKNAEGRVVCLLAEDWETLEYIESGNDIHALTASWIFQKPPEICKKDKEMRNIGKMARHAGNLGQSGAGLSTQVYKSIKYCNEVMDKFHKNAPKVKGVFQFQIQKAIEQYRILRNPFGRFRQFFKMDEKNRYDIYKEAYSYIPQGTVSDHFKMISLKIAERCPNVFQLVEAHDGLLYEIPKGFRDQFADIVLEETSGEIDFTQCTLPRTRKLKIPVEMEFSETNWASMAEYSRETAEVSK